MYLGAAAAGIVLTAVFGIGQVLAQPSSFVVIDGFIRSQAPVTGQNDWGNSGITYNNAGSCTGVQIHAVGTNGLFDCGSVNPTAGHAPIQPNYVGPSVQASTFIVDPLANQGHGDLGNPCIGATGNPLSPTSDLDPTTYTQSTKNGDALTSYTYGPGGLTPKDDIGNLYAVARNGEIFFGGERVINNGDSHFDFEFLQQKLKANPSVAGSCTGAFQGNRSQGDFLTSVDFPQASGAPPTKSVNEWHCDNETTKKGGPVTQPPVGTMCDPGTSNASDPNWNPHYQDISGSTRAAAVSLASNTADLSTGCGGWVCRDEIPAVYDPHFVSFEEFMEGGINLSELGFTGCVNSFIPHTRSSGSFTAQLKDFAGPINFNTCSVTTTPGGTSHFAGANLSDSATVTGFIGGPGTVSFDLYKFPAGTDPASVTSTSCISTLRVATIAGTTNDHASPATFTTSSTYSSAGPGLYEWVASYFDPNETTATVVSTCGQEPWAVNQATPDVTTSPTPAGTLDLMGLTGPVNDTATVGSTTNPGSNPADATGTGLGKVTFKLYGPFNAVPTSASCLSTKEQASAAQTVSGTNSTSGTSATYATSYGAGQGFTPSQAGWYQWIASYAGNLANAPATGVCGDSAEQFRVVDANIQITPLTATNIVGNNHVLTGHVNVNDGSGNANAPVGTMISFAVTNNGATATPANGSCTTVGTTGSCTFTINSATAGTSTIRASVTISLGGLSISRHTGDNYSTDSADAQKTWIAPNTRLTVYDQISGLTSGATGTVTYTAYKSASDCQSNINGTPEGTATTFTGGVSAQSSSVTIGPDTAWGSTIYWTAQYTGNEGTFTSACVEYAVSG